MRFHLFDGRTRLVTTCNEDGHILPGGKFFDQPFPCFGEGNLLRPTRQTINHTLGSIQRQYHAAGSAQLLQILIEFVRGVVAQFFQFHHVAAQAGAVEGLIGRLIVLKTIERRGENFENSIRQADGRMQHDVIKIHHILGDAAVREAASPIQRLLQQARLTDSAEAIEKNQTRSRRGVPQDTLEFIQDVPPPNQFRGGIQASELFGERRSHDFASSALLTGQVCGSLIPASDNAFA